MSEPVIPVRGAMDDGGTLSPVPIGRTERSRSCVAPTWIQNQTPPPSPLGITFHSTDVPTPTAPRDQLSPRRDRSPGRLGLLASGVMDEKARAARVEGPRAAGRVLPLQILLAPPPADWTPELMSALMGHLSEAEALYVRRKWIMNRDPRCRWRLHQASAADQ